MASRPWSPKILTVFSNKLRGFGLFQMDSRSRPIRSLRYIVTCTRIRAITIYVPGYDFLGLEILWNWIFRRWWKKKSTVSLRHDSNVYSLDTRVNIQRKSYYLHASCSKRPVKPRPSTSWLIILSLYSVNPCVWPTMSWKRKSFNVNKKIGLYNQRYFRFVQAVLRGSKI